MTIAIATAGRHRSGSGSAAPRAAALATISAYGMSRARSGSGAASANSPAPRVITAQLIAHSTVTTATRRGKRGAHNAAARKTRSSIRPERVTAPATNDAASTAVDAIT